MHEGTTKRWLLQNQRKRNGDHINLNYAEKRFEIIKFLWSGKQKKLDLEKNVFLSRNGRMFSNKESEFNETLFKRRAIVVADVTKVRLVSSGTDYRSMKKMQRLHSHEVNRSHFLQCSANSDLINKMQVKCILIMQ